MLSDITLSHKSEAESLKTYSFFNKRIPVAAFFNRRFYSSNSVTLRPAIFCHFHYLPDFNPVNLLSTLAMRDGKVSVFFGNQKRKLPIFLLNRC